MSPTYLSDQARMAAYVSGAEGSRLRSCPERGVTTVCRQASGAKNGAELIAEQAFSGFLLAQGHPFALRKRLIAAELADEQVAIVARDATPAALGYLIEQLERSGVAGSHIELLDDPALLLERVEYEGVLTPAIPTSTRAVPRSIVFRPVRGLRIPYALTARWRRTDPNPLIAEMLDALRSAHSKASRATEQPPDPAGKWANGNA